MKKCANEKCGQEFEPRPKAKRPQGGASKDEIYCSDTCGWQVRRERRRESANRWARLVGNPRIAARKAEVKRNRVFQCVECGASFTPKRKDSKRCEPCVRAHKNKKNRDRAAALKGVCLECGGRTSSPQIVRCRNCDAARRRSGYVDRNGYVRFKVKGRVKTGHVLEMERHLGRSIRSSESVHHRNGIRSDNRLVNLELRVRHHGLGQTPKELAEWIVRDYPDEVIAALAAREVDAA